MNTCPVYRRSGGHSYEATVPGPIGSILNPARDSEQYSTLPFACSLCGSCTDVCPVKIDLHHQLLTFRREINVRGHLPWSKRWAMKMASFVFRHPRLYRLLGWFGRFTLPKLPRFLTYNRFNSWGKNRELPEMPKQSFRAMYKNRQQQKN